MTIAVIYITLCVVYLIACILDAPDVKKNMVVTKSKRWRYIHIEKYTENQRLITLHLTMGRWKAVNDVGAIKDRIYILPTISFYFNDSEFQIQVAWLVFESWLWYVNFNNR